MALPLFESYREIPLSRGMTALVDAEDYELLSKWKWHVAWAYRTFYAESWDYSEGKNRIMMHRVIMGCNRKDGKQIDHINGNSLDNRRINLRLVNHSQNQMNRKTESIGSSGHRGVSWCKQTKMWKARFVIHGKEQWLGRFLSKDDAIAAVKSSWAEHYGEYARQV